MRNPVVGDAVFWFGSGRVKDKKFFGKIIIPNVLRDRIGIASRVRANKGQDFIIDENYVYNKYLKKI